MANCRKNIPAFTDLQNCTFESGRVVALAFVTEEKAAVADATPSLWSDPSFWTSETYSGDILIHDKVSGSYTDSPTTVTGKGTQTERNSGSTHTVTTRIESVKGNSDYWSNLKISENYRVVWVGDNYDILFVSQTNCRITPSLIQEDDLNSILEYEVVCVYSDINVPETYDVPTGIFN